MPPKAKKEEVKEATPAASQGRRKSASKSVGRPKKTDKSVD